MSSGRESFRLNWKFPRATRSAWCRGEAAGAAAIAVDSYHLEDVEYTPNPAQPEVKAKRRTKLVVNFARRGVAKSACGSN